MRKQSRSKLCQDSIRDYRGQIIASISTSWLLEIRPELEAEKVASFVVKAANGISKAMGFAERP